MLDKNSKIINWRHRTVIEMISEMPDYIYPKLFAAKTIEI